MTQDVNATEAQMPGVPDDVEENDSAGPALRGKHPVAGPGIFGNVALSAKPDVEAVKRVVENRQPDPEQLQIEDEREAREQFDLFGIRCRAAGRKRIRDEVLDQKCTDGDDAAERMKPAQEE